jgi:NADPH:quinone reductase-like Zn-dependent oxidoreductase
MMKAVVQRRYGGPEEMHLEETAKPVPTPKQVLIEIHATNVSAGDWRVNTSTVPSAWMKPILRLVFGWSGPRQPIRGVTAAGVIVQVGDMVDASSASSLKVGDRVYFINSLGAGCLAEFIALNPDSAVMSKIPAGMDYVHAAPLSFGAMTALHFLNEKTINSGMKVLVYGASGAVGSYAIQLAKHFGAGEVTAVASAGHHAALRELGADKLIDYKTTDFRNAEDGEKYDLIFVAVNQPVTKQSCKCVLAKDAKFCSVESLTDESSKKLQTLNAIVESGHLKTLIDKVYPLDQYREAHEHVYAGHKRGNVVIDMKT